MKTIPSKILCVLFAFFATTLQAQEPPVFHPSTTVKWAPASLLFGKISLGSEYNFAPRRSVTLNIGIPTSTTFKANIDNKDRSLDIKSFSVLAGYRMYLGKKPMTGFYFEPFLQYLKGSTSTATDFSISGQDRNFALNGDYSSFGLGAQLGLQFMIARTVVFDWYIIGPQANISNFSLLAQETGNGAAWDAGAAADAQTEIENFINDVPLIKNKTDIEVNPNARNVKASYKGFLPGFRTGLSLGIRF